MTCRFSALAATMIMLLTLFCPVSVLADEILRLERMVVAEQVIDREPVGIADRFAADREKVYAFVELRGIERDTTVSFAWFRNDREVVTVPLQVMAGNRWRTFSSVTILDRLGDWRVELLDEKGEVLRTVEFRVE